MPRDLPTGTVTLLFTDIEGSTRLLDQLGESAYAEALAEHRSLLRGAFTAHGGVEIGTEGDSFFVAFPDAREACMAAIEGQAALRAGDIRVRMGMHTGTPKVREDDYIGIDVHKAARIAAVGHGGQVLVSDATRALAQVDATPLGVHYLKDIADPVPIFQLGGERFPPLKTISNTNLPRPTTSFVGRETNLEEVVALVRSGARLVTLTGPGGTGKTRLAIAAAMELIPDHRNGVFWVDLAALRDAALVEDAIAQSVGAKVGLADYIQDKRMLLLLDNFEQVVAAAPKVAGLLGSCPNLRIMVTSRELLRVRGEVEYPVPPLERAEAQELFHRRSGVPSDETIAELCRRLDDLPLAVELAASRARLLSPAQILERLTKRLDLFKGGRDADPRQETLRATIGWSYDLLSDAERQLFARLSVFAGGCTVESAEDVAEADLDTLQSLFDKSLVRHSEGRFWMLETIREFASERMDDATDASETRRRHAEHFLDLVESMEEYNLRGYATQTLDALSREHENIRAAIDHFEALGETQRMLRLTSAMMPFWRDRGFLAEGWRRIVRALEADDRPTGARALALEHAAESAVVTGRPGVGLRYAEEAVKIRRGSGDAGGLGGSLNALGVALAHVGEREAARRPLEEAAAAFREAGDEHSALWADRSVAWCYTTLGLLDRARELHEKNLVAAREFGDRGLEALSADALAMIAMEEGRLEEASVHLISGLTFWKDFGDLLEIPAELSRAARYLAVAKQPVPAARLLSCAQSYLQARGIADIDRVRINEETLEIIRPQLGVEALERALEDGRTMTEAEAIDFALDALKRDSG